MNYRYVNTKKLNKAELFDLGKSIAVITIIFSVAYYSVMNSVISAILWSLLFVGTGFVLHEMAHKYFAIKYGALARFQGNDKMLIISLLISLVGLILIAPGAVVIRGNLTRKQYGITSLAGPATNILLSIIFLILSFVWPVMLIGSAINAFLAAFNLLPFPPFDGQKVLSWDKKIYGVSIAFAVLLYFVTQFI